MRNLLVLVMGLLSLRPGSAVPVEQQDQAGIANLLDVNVRTLDDSKEVNLAREYAGKVVLIVNTASKCAFTSQYEGLEELYAKYKEQGLVVLGFPSNDFANQEPGTEAEIKSFCRLTYGVRFPMFGKTRVRKQNADELYKRLGETADEYPAWNFHKYLVNRQGKLVASYSSFTSPKSSRLVNKIESLL